MRKLVAFMAAGLLASTSGYAAVNNSSAARNYDASYAALASARADGSKANALNLHSRTPLAAALKTPSFPSNYDRTLGSATFLWAPANSHVPAVSAKTSSAVAFSPLQPSLRTETVARSYLSQQASYLRLDRGSIADARLGSVHDTGRGPIIARFQQYKDGLEVFGRSLNVMMDRKLNAVATSGYFAPAPQGKAAASARAVTTPSFAISGESAISHAFTNMGGKLTPFALTAAQQSGNLTEYAVGKTTTDYRLTSAPRAKKVYYYNAGQYVPAWYVEVFAGTQDNANKDAFAYVISAADGKVLFRKDLTAYDAFSYHVFANSTAPYQPEDEPINNNTLDPFTGGPTGDQGRTQGTYNLINLVNSGQISDATAKNDPWLPAGATVTTGNNVTAFANIAGSDGFQTGDVRGAVSSAGVFDYPYTTDADPTTASQRQAAIVNQFFVDNWLHDTWYEHGFNEAAGNAQTDNYGRGGVAGDPIQAQAQDNSGRNNANMQTPSDGRSPIQRMFLWDGPLAGTATLNVTSPAGIGVLPFATADFGPRQFTVTGAVKRPEAGNEGGCNAITTDLTGAIALIDRGTCSFKTKTLNAQNAHAAAVVLADNLAHCNVPTDLSTCEPAPALGDDNTITTTISIGTVSVSYPDGQKIEAASGTPQANLVVQFQPDRDGTMDIQIVAHEFFHYVSNRLVGNAIGLSTEQGGGMGEGWSDFDAMLLTVRPEDAAVSGNDKYQGAYPLSSYVTFNQYFGIRRYPYSTQTTVNPLTFKHISFGVALPSGVPAAPGTDLTGTLATDPAGNVVGNAEVHATGEIWCNTLWEFYASLLNDPRYTFAQAKSRMQDYIIEGLSMTPNAPTMLEARDALLAAAKATDSGDFTLMAKAFAKRGMGVGAIAPDRSDIQQRGAVESFNAVAAGVEVTDAKVTFTATGNVLGDQDGDGILDAGETAVLTFTFTNNGTADMSGTITGTVTGGALNQGDTADFSFSNGGAVTVPKLAAGQSGTGSVQVTLNSTSSPAIETALVLSFPAANDPTGTIPSGGTAATGGELDLLVNYDLVKNSTSDDVEDTQANLADWTRSSNGTPGPDWQLANDTELFGGPVFTDGQYWFGPDNNNPSDITLASPELDVGTDALTLSFDHFFDFEFDSGNAGFDGGVIELSSDGGATWKDIFSTDVGATMTTGAGYNGTIESLDADGTFDPGDGGNHPGFVGVNVDLNNPAFEHMVISFGTKFSGQKVKVRFRALSDLNTGVIGWIVDNIAFTGLTNKPFSKTVADAGAADLKPTAAISLSPHEIHPGDTATADGSGSTDPYNGQLTYAWTASDGITLSDATAAKPTFTAPIPGNYSVSLTVTDALGRTGTTTQNFGVRPGPGGGAFGPWLLLPGFALVALRRRKRKH